MAEDPANGFVDGFDLNKYLDEKGDTPVKPTTFRGAFRNDPKTSETTGKSSPPEGEVGSVERIALEFEVPTTEGVSVDPNVTLQYLKKYFRISNLLEIGEIAAENEHNPGTSGGNSKDTAHPKRRGLIPLSINNEKSLLQQKIRKEGYSMFFPYKPYPQQEEFARGLVDAIEKSENALVESPTGTGKTLCLLVSALTWLRKNIEEKKNTGAKIFYASRTHSQLSQILKELKSTCYTPCVSILGSRDQLCVHKELSKDSGIEKVNKCFGKIRTKSCDYYTNTNQSKKTLIDDYKAKVMDIEDFTKEGGCRTFCPYYLSRMLIKDAHLVILPYNYIVSSEFRKLISEYLENSVLIIDEAHNIGKFAEEGASITLTVLDLIKAVEDINRCKTSIEERSPFGQEDHAFNLVSSPIDNLKQYLIGKGKSQNYPSFEFPGEEIFNIFRESLEVDKTSTRLEKTALDKLDPLLLSINVQISEILRLISRFFKVNRGAASLNNLDRWLRILGRVQELYINFKEESAKKPFKWGKVAINFYNTLIEEKFTATTQMMQIKLKCHSPAFTFREIMAEGVAPRSVIFASGTLSPLEGYTAEFEMEFAFQKQFGHVINPDMQIFNGILQSLANGKEINFAYNQRNDQSLIDELGKILIAVFKVSPKGALIFFTSYNLMKTYIDHWKANSMLAEMEKIKTLSIENSRNASQKKGLKKYLDNYNKEGAAFFAVFGGKLSEGIDFTDDMARLVILIGAPYPNFKDLEITTKKKFLDRIKEQEPRFTIHTPRGMKQFTRSAGMEWYHQQAIRTANQSIGRVIRHRSDYGAIVLLDSRYSNDFFRGKLSKWASEKLQIFDALDLLIKGLCGFFIEAEEYAKKNGNVMKKVDTDKILDDEHSNPDDGAANNPEAVAGHKAGSRYLPKTAKNSNIPMQRNANPSSNFESTQVPRFAPTFPQNRNKVSESPEPGAAQGAGAAPAKAGKGAGALGRGKGKKKVDTTNMPKLSQFYSSAPAGQPEPSIPSNFGSSIFSQIAPRPVAPAPENPYMYSNPSRPAPAINVPTQRNVVRNDLFSTSPKPITQQPEVSLFGPSKESTRVKPNMPEKGGDDSSTQMSESLWSQPSGFLSPGASGSGASASNNYGGFQQPSSLFTPLQSIQESQMRPAVGDVRKRLEMLREQERQAQNGKKSAGKKSTGKNQINKKPDPSPPSAPRNSSFLTGFNAVKQSNQVKRQEHFASMQEGEPGPQEQLHHLHTDSGLETQSDGSSAFLQQYRHPATTSQAQNHQPQVPQIYRPVPNTPHPSLLKSLLSPASYAHQHPLFPNMQAADPPVAAKHAYQCEGCQEDSGVLSLFQHPSCGYTGCEICWEVVHKNEKACPSCKAPVTPAGLRML